MADDEKRTRLEQAQRLFTQYYGSCFWHCKPDLVVTEAMIPMIVKRLCQYGGQKGLREAAKLQKTEER